MESTSVDLVLSTLGARPAELQRFLDCLESQSHRNFRLIAADQSEDGWVVERLQSSPPGFPVVAVRSSGGVSGGRNDGLRHAQADIAAFPDDDCWYGPDLLARVVELFEANPGWGGLSARSLDAEGRPSNMRWHRHPGPITKLNSWHRAIAYTVFFRRDLVAASGRFDRTLGAPLPAGEETDFLLRALVANYSIQYEPALTVHHAQANPSWAIHLGRASLRHRHGPRPPAVRLSGLVRPVAGRPTGARRSMVARTRPPEARALLLCDGAGAPARVGARERGLGGAERVLHRGARRAG